MNPVVPINPPVGPPDAVYVVTNPASQVAITPKKLPTKQTAAIQGIEINNLIK
jgi:hypothetical protein